MNERAKITAHHLSRQAIVYLRRKLLVALWKYVSAGS
jgi:hypothetical protein